MNNTNHNMNNELNNVQKNTDAEKSAEQAAEKASEGAAEKRGRAAAFVEYLKNRRLGAWPTYLSMFLFSCGILVLEFVYAVENTFTWSRFFEFSGVFLLNLFPIFSTTLFLYFLTRSARFAMIANFIFYNVIFIVNRIKILYRNEPLYVSDLRLGLESVTITKGQNYSPGSLMLLLSFSALVILLAGSFYFRFSKPRWRVSLLGMSAIVLLSWAMYRNVYTDQALYQHIHPKIMTYGDRYSAENKGILYYLLYTVQSSFVRAPEGYRSAEFSDIRDGDGQMELRPNILMIMGEAYFDLSKLEIFGYPNGVSPTQQFDRLAKDALLTGRIVVPSFGGGTADTEFDVLTGCQTIRCAPNMTFAFNSVLRDTGSIARVLKKHGYFTRAFHPGFNFFYKRQTVYPRLGFDACYFEDSIENQVLVSGYMQERQTFDEYQKRLFEHVESGASSSPLFDYMVTIQNHGPYYRGKFLKNFKFECSVPLEDRVRGCLEGYFQGVHEMDVELGRLADAVENRPEPYLIVFYGDHLPSLYGGNQSYEETGFDIASDSFESEARRHSTPYLIWANKSYRKALEARNAAPRGDHSQGSGSQSGGAQSEGLQSSGSHDEDWQSEGAHGAETAVLRDLLPPSLRGEDVSLISANYLGGLVLQLIGADEGDDYFENLNRMRILFPSLSRHYVYDGSESRIYDDVQSEELERYYRYQYYRIHDSK